MTAATVSTTCPDWCDRVTHALDGQDQYPAHFASVSESGSAFAHYLNVDIEQRLIGDPQRREPVVRLHQVGLPDVWAQTLLLSARDARTVAEMLVAAANRIEIGS